LKKGKKQDNSFYLEKKRFFLEMMLDTHAMITDDFEKDLSFLISLHYMEENSIYCKAMWECFEVYNRNYMHGCQNINNTIESNFSNFFAFISIECREYLDEFLKNYFTKIRKCVMNRIYNWVNNIDEINNTKEIDKNNLFDDFFKHESVKKEAKELCNKYSEAMNIKILIDMFIALYGVDRIFNYFKRNKEYTRFGISQNEKEAKEFLLAMSNTKLIDEINQCRINSTNQMYYCINFLLAISNSCKNLSQMILTIRFLYNITNTVIFKERLPSMNNNEFIYHVNEKSICNKTPNLLCLLQRSIKQFEEKNKYKISFNTELRKLLVQDNWPQIKKLYDKHVFLFS
jgi:hypothetical protein